MKVKQITMTRSQLVSLIGNLFTHMECRNAKQRLLLLPENARLWALLNDAELGDYLDNDLPDLIER